MLMLKYTLGYYNEDTYKPMRNPDILYQFCKDNEIFVDYYFYKQDNGNLYFKSKKYLDSVNKKENEFNLLSPITGYTYRNSYEKWSLSYNGLIDDLGFNTVQGFNASLGFSYFNQQNKKGSI